MLMYTTRHARCTRLERTSHFPSTGSEPPQMYAVGDHVAHAGFCFGKSGFEPSMVKWTCHVVHIFDILGIDLEVTN